MLSSESGVARRGLKFEARAATRQQCVTTGIGGSPRSLAGAGAAKRIVPATITRDNWRLTHYVKPAAVEWCSRRHALPAGVRRRSSDVNAELQRPLSISGGIPQRTVSLVECRSSVHASCAESLYQTMTSSARNAIAVVNVLCWLHAHLTSAILHRYSCHRAGT